MILEAMNNQYLIAEHYYDLTEYIDKNIYKFRRNGKYLQEGFGTVALWIAGIALAAGIGWWVYKKFFDKKQNDSNEAKVKQEIATAQESETAANEVNSQLQLENKLLSEKEFLSNQKFNEALKQLQNDYSGQSSIDNDKAYNAYIDLNAKLLKENLPNNSKISEDQIKKLLKSTLKKPQNGKDNSNLISKFGTKIKGIYDCSVNFIENSLTLNQATTVYQKSLTMALYYMNYFLTVDILLSSDPNQKDNIDKNYKNFQKVENSINTYIKSISESQENVKNPVKLNQLENIYSNITLDPSTLTNFGIPKFPTISNFNNFNVDDYATTDINTDTTIKICLEIQQKSRDKQVKAPSAGSSPVNSNAGGSSVTPSGLGSQASGSVSQSQTTAGQQSITGYSNIMGKRITELSKYSVVFQDADIIEFLKLPWITDNLIKLLNEAETFIQNNLNDKLKDLYNQQEENQTPLFTQCYALRGSYGDKTDQEVFKQKIFTLFSILLNDDNNKFFKEFENKSTPFAILFGDIYDILQSDFKLFEFNAGKIETAQEFMDFYHKFHETNKTTLVDLSKEKVVSFFTTTVPAMWAKAQPLLGSITKACGGFFSGVVTKFNQIFNKKNNTNNQQSSPDNSIASSGRTIDEVRSDIHDLVNKFGSTYTLINIDLNNDLTDEKIKTSNYSSIETKLSKITDTNSEEYQIYQKFLDLINEGKQILNNSAGGNVPSSGDSSTTQPQQQNAAGATPKDLTKIKNIITGYLNDTAWKSFFKWENETVDSLIKKDNNYWDNLISQLDPNKHPKTIQFLEDIKTTLYNNSNPSNPTATQPSTSSTTITIPNDFVDNLKNAIKQDLSVKGSTQYNELKTALARVTSLNEDTFDLDNNNDFKHSNIDQIFKNNAEKIIGLKNQGAIWNNSEFYNTQNYLNKIQ